MSSKFNNILPMILNKRYTDKQQIIGTVTSLYPLKAKLYPTDTTSINIVSTTNLSQLAIGSRILLQKYNNTYIGIAVIGTPERNHIQRLITSATTTSTTMGDSGLSITIPPDNKNYELDLHLIMSCPTTGIDCKIEWILSGTYYTLSARHSRGYSGTSGTGLVGQDVKASYYGYTTDVYYPINDTNDETIIHETAVIRATIETTIQINFACVASGDTLTMSGSSYFQRTMYRSNYES